jgi:hypothetical protein
MKQQQDTLEKEKAMKKDELLEINAKAELFRKKSIERLHRTLKKISQK